MLSSKIFHWRETKEKCNFIFAASWKSVRDCFYRQFGEDGEKLAQVSGRRSLNETKNSFKIYLAKVSSSQRIFRGSLSSSCRVMLVITSLKYNNFISKLIVGNSTFTSFPSIVWNCHNFVESRERAKQNWIKRGEILSQNSPNLVLFTLIAVPLRIARASGDMEKWISHIQLDLDTIKNKRGTCTGTTSEKCN